MSYIHNVVVALDELGNALAGGDPRQTISERAARRLGDSHAARVFCFLIGIVLGHDHCQDQLE